jgi:hypothetical protein
MGVERRAPVYIGSLVICWRFISKNLIPFDGLVYLAQTFLSQVLRLWI